VSQSAIPRDNHLLRITKAERVRAVILPSAGLGVPTGENDPAISSRACRGRAQVLLHVVSQVPRPAPGVPEGGGHALAFNKINAAPDVLR
jgi:hypothetical protein